MSTARHKIHTHIQTHALKDRHTYTHVTGDFEHSFIVSNMLGFRLFLINIVLVSNLAIRPLKIWEFFNLPISTYISRSLSLSLYIVCLLFLSYRSEQVPNWHLLKTQGQCMKEHDNSLKEEVCGEVIFLVTTKD